MTSYVAIRRWFKILLGIYKQARLSLPNGEDSADFSDTRREDSLYRDLSSDSYAVQQSFLIAMVVDRVVERRSVVPNRYVAGHPVVAIGELRSRAPIK